MLKYIAMENQFLRLSVESSSLRDSLKMPIKAAQYRHKRHKITMSKLSNTQNRTFLISFKK